MENIVNFLCYIVDERKINKLESEQKILIMANFNYNNSPNLRQKIRQN